MKRKNILDGKKIIERFKKSLDIKMDVELAEILGVLPSTISTWKKRNSLNHTLLIELCKRHKIDLNYLFFGALPTYAPNKNSRTPLISRFVLHEYIMGALEGTLSDLPTYVFPFVKNGISRAFQAISGNMSPLVEENSLVICERMQPDGIQENQVLVFISRKKGFFLNRVKKIDGKSFLLIDDNPHYTKNDIQLEKKDIDEVWSVKGILNTIMHERYEPNYLPNEKPNDEIQKALIKKKRELVANSLKLAHLKNEIENLLKNIDTKKSNGMASKLKALSAENGTWNYFMKKFVDVHPDFIQKLQKRHHLSKNDIDFCSLILLGLSNKEIGVLLNISHQSVITKKYRLRKKMNFSTRHENSLEEYLLNFK